MTIAVINLLLLISLVNTTPLNVRTQEKVDTFRHFLESTKTSDEANFFARVRANPLANPEENSGHYQGDIILDDWMIDRMVQKYAIGRNAYVIPRSFWPNKTVVWEFGQGEFDESQKEAIIEAIKEIEKNSCVRFRYRAPEDTAFVRVTGGPEGCLAHVGYCAPRGVHILNLARNHSGVGCLRHGNIVHEWFHTLGLLHMHSTYDRDHYVQIAVENVTPGLEHNFDKFGPGIVSNLGVEYDYISIMHYGAYAFSRNGEKTVVALQEHEGEMGQRDVITEKDWLRLNRHYRCPGAWERDGLDDDENSEDDDIDDVCRYNLGKQFEN